MIKLVTRAVIRHYLVDMFKDEVDVGNRVFANRPSDAFLEELPCLFLFFEDEPTEIIVGDRFGVKVYQRTAQLNVCVVCEGLRTPDESAKNKGEDFLDFLGHQVEQAFYNDWRLARRLKDFDPNTNYEGLTHGNRLVSVTPYEVDTDSERRMLAQDLRWVVPYQTNAFVDKKYDSFEAYKADIIRVGSTAETVDRVLLSAEGELDE